jgi:autotransporter-associated beta strand protein
LADTSPTGQGLGFATYDETNGVRLLAASEQTTVASGGAYDTVPTTDNILFNLSGNETITGHLSNTLQFKNVSGLGRTVTNTTTTLNANGMLFSGTDPIVLTGGQITGTADSDSEDVLIHSLNTSTAGVTIQTPISNVGSTSPRPGWIAYNGTGNFRLEGAHTVGNAGGVAFNSKGTTTIATTISGASILSLNQGIVRLGVAESWTNTPRLMVAPEAKFDLNGNGSTATANRFTDINAPVVASGLSFNLGGEVTNSGSTTVDLLLSTATNGATSTPYFGTITGNLNLIVDKSNFNSANSTYTYGTQSLGNVNTYTGFTQVRSGVLNIARGGRLPVTTVVRLGVTDSNANSTLSLGDNNGSTNGSVRQEIAGLEAADVGIGTGVAAVINNGSNLSQLTLNIASGENKYNGNLGVALTTNGSNSNGFGLRKIGAGIFEPAGPINTYSGGTIIQGGILRVSADSKLGQIGPITGVAGSPGASEAPISAFANNIILDGGTLQTTTTADFVLNPKRGIGLGPVSGATGGTGSLSVDAGVKLTYAGVIASAGNTGSNTLVKSGDGVLALDGANTFTGLTQVATGSLGGVGSLASNVTIASGAALAPGNGGIGTFIINGALTLSGGAVLNMDLGAAGTPGNSDRIQLGGTFSKSGTTTVNFADAGGFGVGTYTLISGTAPISTSGFSVGTIPSGFQGTFSSVGNTLVVTIAVGSQQTALESWRQTNFGSSANSGNGADGADPDADGLANLLEYATNSNPMVSGPSSLTVARSGNFLTLTYTRIADTTLTYTVEGSNDLVTWSTVATANNPSAGAQNVAGPVTVTDTVSLTNRRFLRLKVSY